MAEKERHNTGSTVWHYTDDTGQVIRRRLPRGAEPEAHWKRGFGPHSREIADRIAARTREIHCGKTVSRHTRQLMRAAKLGVPKTAEHRANMSLAQLERNRRRRASEAK